MRGGWNTQKLGKLLSVQNGFAFESKLFGTEGMPLIRIRDLKNGQGTETRFSGDYDPRYVVRAGDFLIGMDGEFRCHQWTGEAALLNQRVCRLHSFDDQLEPRFLFHSINSHLRAIEAVTGFTTVKHLSSKQILDIEIAFPPKAEQQRIVTILDDAFTNLAIAKANTEQCLTELDQLFSSYLESMLINGPAGWRMQALSEIVDEGCSLSYGIVQPGSDQPGGLPIVRPTDLGTKVVELEGLKRINPEAAKAYRRTTLAGGDILLCVRGTTGVLSIASKELAGANVTRGIVPIRFDGAKLSQPFGYYALMSSPAQRQIREKTYGTALQQINIADLRKVIIPIPTLEEQDVMVKRLDGMATQVEQLRASYQCQLAAIDALKQSLIAKASAAEL